MTADLLTAFLYGYIIIVGLCIGSFCNVLIYRIPRGINIAKGRSFCPACSHSLAAIDLVPVFSWLALRRKCRYCGAPISVRYPLIELAGGLAALLSALALGFTASALFAFLAACILMTVAMIDWDTQEIPDSLVVALACVGLLSALLTRDASWVARLIGAACVSVPMLLMNCIKRESFGGGDIKLCLAAGFLLGWQHMLLAGFLALLTGGGYGVYLLLSKKAGRGDHFAFGPFLSFGIVLAILYGEPLIRWYLGLFL